MFVLQQLNKQKQKKENFFLGSTETEMITGV